MTKQTEALRMAIEALIYHTEQTRPIEDTDKALQACKEALEPTVAELNDEYLREWQSLSDEEIWDIANFLGKNKEWDYPVMFAKTIEKALREKNNE
jgi:hypothetical protein